jgi:nucleoside-diphosphate-sugar epimerase
LTWFGTNRGWDISRARTELGFRPRVNLEEGLKLTMEWYQSRGLL